MSRIQAISVLFLLGVFVQPATADEARTGPIIRHFGRAYTVVDTALNLDPDEHYRIVMDIGDGPDDPSLLNRHIESAARFLNMHAQNGFDPQHLALAIVLHGAAAIAALKPAAARTKLDSAIDR